MDIIQSLALTVFGAGILMFLAPCTFPLVPAILASLSTRLHAGDQSSKSIRIEITTSALLFSLGFTVVFVIFGVLASYIGAVVQVYKDVLSQCAGLLMIFFGLSMVGIRAFDRVMNVFTSSPLIQKGRGRTHAILLGSFFALGFAPCSGPILASVLLLASQTETVVQGGALLAIFSLGLTIPFTLTGILYGHTLGLFKAVGKYTGYISKVSGVILIGFGILLLTNKYILLTSWGFAVFNFFGYTPMCAF